MYVGNNIGPLIRILRLQNNWSLETLANGICSVSYLSKIEQGKAETNQHLLYDIFKKLGFTWTDDPYQAELCDRLYEGILSWDDTYIKQQFSLLEKIWPDQAFGPYYVDFLIIRAYIMGECDSIPDSFIPSLDNRQRALYFILQNRHIDAYHIYPCPLTAFCVAEEAFMEGNYIQALEFLQIVCTQAAAEGYVHLQMIGESYMANCYSDIGNLDVMYRHNRIAARLGRILGKDEFVRTIEYNIAATKLEQGCYEDAYRYFSNLDNPSLMELHKLAICCEGLGKIAEANHALEKAGQLDALDVETNMLALVKYRLDHSDYLKDQQYGDLLLSTFEEIKKHYHAGYVRFHLHWVTQWLTANRQYRKAFEIINNFPGNHF